MTPHDDSFCIIRISACLWQYDYFYIGELPIGHKVHETQRELDLHVRSEFESLPSAREASNHPIR